MDNFLFSYMSLAGRAMYVWIPVSPNDPLETSQKRAGLLSFCAAHSITQIYLDMYNYLGADNGSEAKTAIMQEFIANAHARGMTVHALAGDTDWSDTSTHSWIATNITGKIYDYNIASSLNQRFDGFSLDVEFWITAQPEVDAIAGLLALVTNMKSTLGLPVGCFTHSALLDEVESRPPVIYNAKNAQAGAHMMDYVDYVIVAGYRRRALDTESDCIICNGFTTIFNPWYNYAVANQGSADLILAVETNNIFESDLSFYSLSKSYMESQIVIGTAPYSQAYLKCFAIHDYPGWSALT